MKFPILFQKKHPEPLNTAIKVAKKHNSQIKNKHIKDCISYCPHCGSPLVATGRLEQLMTYLEDVMCCYGNISPKPTYVCPNGECDLHNHAKWVPTGEGYPNRGSSIDVPSALNSVMFTTDCRKTSSIKFNWFEKMLSWFGCKHPFMPVIELKYEPDGFGKMKYVKTKLLYYQRRDSNSYFIYSSACSRLRSLYRLTKSDYKKFKESEFTDIDCLNRIYGHMWDGIPIPPGCLNKFWYKTLIPFVFGTLMGHKEPKIMKMYEV